MNEIHITHLKDIDKIKITKVRDWSICFDYNNKHYLIHGKKEYGECSQNNLYERTIDKNGKYSLAFLKSCRVMNTLLKNILKKVGN